MISGPESSGKTTLFKALCDVYSIKGVSEYARDYILNIGRAYKYNDILQIAKQQFINEQQYLEMKQPFFLADSDLLTLEIWCEFKYGKCHTFISENLRNHLPEIYLLCYPDIKWEYDPQRENPNDRLALFDIYESKIKSFGVDYHILRGDKPDRLKSAKTIINRIANS